MITGVEVTKIEALRGTTELIANMRFNINFDTVKVTSENVSVGFTFVASYEGTPAGTAAPKEVGKLTISGNVLAKETKDEAKEVEKVWASKKTLPIKFAEDVINILNFECGARGTLVAYSIGFVAPLPLSRAKLQEDGSS